MVAIINESCEITNNSNNNNKTIFITLEVQDQTKNGLWDDPSKGFPTTNRQSLVEMDFLGLVKV